MDKHKLSQLRYLKSEIAMLKEQIGDIQVHTTKDSVKASQTDWPYIEYAAKIEGADIQEYARKLRRRQRRLDRRVKELMDLVDEIEEYINTIDDSLTRQAIMLKYVNGLEWRQVAAHIGGGNTAEGLRKRVQRFFQEN